jgi:valyl-tRNA synthetase
MENIKDWCISRQLWWGHRIPAWFMPQGGYVVALTREEAYRKALQTVDYPLAPDDLKQDEDVLDTWFSSWLWPLSLFNGIDDPANRDINYYYPTSDLVTGPDIIFFWVARMIMAGYEYRHEPCFRNVYFTGIVRDKLGRKMSKSLGNSPEPLELIGKYGADGVRMGMLLSSAAGNDLLFDETLCEQGRNFNNKIWNAFRLVRGWEIDESIPQLEAAKIAAEWFQSKLAETVAEMDDLFSKYRLSEALMLLYKLFWDEFSAWYLELVKPAYQQPVDAETYTVTLHFFDALMRLLHPFMPFITEELWQALYDRKAGDSIMTTLQPGLQPVDKALLASFEALKEVVAGVRTVRLEKNIPNKDELELHIIGRHNHQFDCAIARMCRLSSISPVTEKQPGAPGFLVGTTEYVIPLAGKTDVKAELRKLHSELAYAEGFLQSVLKKLGNERFVQNAKPDVVEGERRKRADVENKIALLKENIAALSSGK